MRKRVRREKGRGSRGKEDRKEGEGGQGGQGREGKVGRGGGGGGSWQFITFFGFQLLQHPRLLALFAVGLRLHMLSQIPWKGMRTDSGMAGGQGTRVVPGGAGTLLCPGAQVRGAATAAVHDGTEELGRVGEGL